MAEGMLKAACGERPDNVVNPQVFDQPAFREKLSRFDSSKTMSSGSEIKGQAGTEVKRTPLVVPLTSVRYHAPYDADGAGD